MTNEQLVALIQNHIDEAENMLQLWEQCKKFITVRAKRLLTYAELEDLEQEGFVGLCHAVQHYDQDAGAPFITYAAFWIDQAMRRYTENCCGVVRVPTHAKYKVLKLKKMRAEFSMRYGRSASDEEERLFLGVGKEEHENIKQVLKMGNIASLDSVIGGEDDDITLADTVPGTGDLEAEVLEAVHQEELSGVLWGIVDTLPGKQPELLRGMYIDSLTLADASERIGISSRAGQSERDKAMRALRRPQNAAQLRPFLPDHVSSIAYGGSIAGFKRTWTSSTERAVFLDIGEC